MKNKKEDVLNILIDHKSQIINWDESWASVFDFSNFLFC